MALRVVGWAVVRVVEIDELAVAVFQLHRYIARDVGRSVADIGNVELDAIRTPDLNPMRSAVEGIAQWLALAFEVSRNGDVGGTFVLIHFELDRQPQVLKNVVGHRVKDPPVVGRLFGLLALDDSGDSVGLLVSSAWIDHRLHRAATLEDGAGPLEDQRHGNPGKIDVAEVPSFDIEDFDSLAGVVRR